MGLIDIANEIIDNDKIDIWKNFNPTWYQKEYLESDCQYEILIVGRRGGKSEVGIRDIISDALKDPGEYQIVAPEWKQCKVTLKKAMDVLRPYRDRVIHRERVSSPPFFIELTNGAEILWASGDDPNNVRGQGPKKYFLDEFRFQKEEQIWDVIRPACMDYGAKVGIVTTPFGINNYTYQLWLRGMDPDHWPQYKAWGYKAGTPDRFGQVSQYDRGIPSYENPFLVEDPKTLCSEMSQFAYEREILAIFHPDLDVAIRVPRDVWGTCDWWDGPRNENEVYFAGFDVGRHADYSVITIMDTDSCVRRMYRTQIDYKSVKEWAIGHFKHWNNCLALMDATGIGDPLFESMIDDYGNVAPRKISDNTIKTALVTGLQLGFDHAKIKLPAISGHEDTLGVLQGELATFTMKQTPSGVVQYMAKDGYHDDTVMSLALCYHLVRGNNVQGMSDIWQKGWESLI